ncbi:hypothetical protein Bca52824_036867 [Brassica carinata]|uniref:Uncharacterized protein n=1 Tax=Brassica carinata TaxID=52824 RepID=A0A8X7S5P9_BRACI|nr:hypothetical protein Bca52824_036867 [Brassica carinata]
MQLDSHSVTREQAQMREQTLVEENSANESAISICETKKRKEKDGEESLKTEQEASLDERHSKGSGETAIQPDGNGKDGADTEAMKFVMLQKLESKKNDLSSMEEKELEGS